MNKVHVFFILMYHNQDLTIWNYFSGVLYVRYYLEKAHVRPITFLFGSSIPLSCILINDSDEAECLWILYQQLQYNKAKDKTHN